MDRAEVVAREEALLFVKTKVPCRTRALRCSAVCAGVVLSWRGTCTCVSLVLLPAPCFVFGFGAVLCCAVLCCAVLCCAVLCCAVLCCVVLCCAVLCCVRVQLGREWDERKHGLHTRRELHL